MSILDNMLFDPDQREEAVEYLANHMGNTMVAGIVGETEDGEFQEVSPDQVPTELLIPMFRNLVENAYGVNAVDMANYLRVEEVFHEKYKDSILTYLNYIGIEANYVVYKPSILVPYILALKASQPGFVPPMAFNPMKKWKSLAYGNDPLTNLTNPINSYDHVYLNITNIRNEGFTNFIFNANPQAREYIAKAYNEGKAINVNLALLPNKSLDPIANIVAAIHKYL